MTRIAKHGRQYRYRFTYSDSHDAGCPDFTWSCWAYDREDAFERFHDAPDAEGWRIKSVERVTEAA